jgi:hypothetical protein
LFLCIVSFSLCARQLVRCLQVTAPVQQGTPQQKHSRHKHCRSSEQPHHAARGGISLDVLLKRLHDQGSSVKGGGAAAVHSKHNEIRPARGVKELRVTGKGLQKMCDKC